MATRNNLADIFKKRLAGVAERSRVLGRALKVRANMAATRRRLRTTFATMGEELYTRMRADQIDTLADDSQLATLAERADELKAELKELEEELRTLMQTGVKIEPDDLDDVDENEFGAGTVVPKDTQE
jgi:hypothetical protein